MVTQCEGRGNPDECSLLRGSELSGMVSVFTRQVTMASQPRGPALTVAKAAGPLLSDSRGSLTWEGLKLFWEAEL